jgi:hypothetical protein
MSAFGIATSSPVIGSSRIQRTAAAMEGAGATAVDQPPAAAGGGGGSGNGAEDTGAPSNTTKATAFKAIGILIKWIPAEIIALYGAFVATQVAAALAAGTVVKPDWTLWWIMLAATPVYVAVVALLTDSRKDIVAKVLISIPSFVVWTATVPGSIWGDLEWFQNASGPGFIVIALLAGLIALLGNKFAPGVTAEG